MTTTTTDSTTKRQSIVARVMRYIIPLIITVGLCWVMFSKISFSEMVDIIRHECDFRFIGVALVLCVFSHVFRALRWRLQLLALGVNASRWELVLSVFGNYAVNLVFPRLGEVWRSGFVAQRQDAPFATVFGSMVAERLADTIVLMILMVATFIAASSTIVDYLSVNQEAYVRIMAIVRSPWLWIAVLACLAAVWWLLTRRWPEGTLMSKLQRFAKGLWHGFAVIAKMHGKMLWLFYTLCIWGIYFLQMYIEFYAFPFTAQVIADHGILAVFLTFVISSMAMVVPSNGGIGPWQFAVIFALGIYGVSQVDSGAFANLVLGTQTLLLIILGIFTFIAIMLSKNKQKRKLVTETN